MIGRVLLPAFFASSMLVRASLSSKIDLIVFLFELIYFSTTKVAE
jgi:hypothetical protein